MYPLLSLFRIVPFPLRFFTAFLFQQRPLFVPEPFYSAWAPKEHHVANHLTWFHDRPHFAPDEADGTMGNPREQWNTGRLEIICSYSGQTRKCVRINCPIAPIVQIAPCLYFFFLRALFWPQKMRSNWNEKLSVHRIPNEAERERERGCCCWNFLAAGFPLFSYFLEGYVV